MSLDRPEIEKLRERIENSPDFAHDRGRLALELLRRAAVEGDEKYELARSLVESSGALRFDYDLRGDAAVDAVESDPEMQRAFELLEIEGSRFKGYVDTTNYSKRLLFEKGLDWHERRAEALRAVLDNYGSFVVLEGELDGFFNGNQVLIESYVDLVEAGDEAGVRALMRFNSRAFVRYDGVLGVARAFLRAENAMRNVSGRPFEDLNDGELVVLGVGDRVSEVVLGDIVEGDDGEGDGDMGEFDGGDFEEFGNDDGEEFEDAGFDGGDGFGGVGNGEGGLGDGGLGGSGSGGGYGDGIGDGGLGYGGSGKGKGGFGFGGGGSKGGLGFGDGSASGGLSYGGNGAVGGVGGGFNVGKKGNGGGGLSSPVLGKKNDGLGNNLAPQGSQSSQVPQLPNGPQVPQGLQVPNGIQASSVSQRPSNSQGPSVSQASQDPQASPAPQPLPQGQADPSAPQLSLPPILVQKLKKGELKAVDTHKSKSRPSRPVFTDHTLTDSEKKKLKDLEKLREDYFALLVATGKRFSKNLNSTVNIVNLNQEFQKLKDGIKSMKKKLKRDKKKDKVSAEDLKKAKRFLKGLMKKMPVMIITNKSLWKKQILDFVSFDFDDKDLSKDPDLREDQELQEDGDSQGHEDLQEDEDLKGDVEAQKDGISKKDAEAQGNTEAKGKSNADGNSDSHGSGGSSSDWMSLGSPDGDVDIEEYDDPDVGDAIDLKEGEVVVSMGSFLSNAKRKASENIFGIKLLVALTKEEFYKEKLKAIEKHAKELKKLEKSDVSDEDKAKLKAKQEAARKAAEAARISAKAAAKAKAKADKSRIEADKSKRKSSQLSAKYHVLTEEEKKAALDLIKRGKILRASLEDFDKVKIRSKKSQKEAQEAKDAAVEAANESELSNDRLENLIIDKEMADALADLMSANRSEQDANKKISGFKTLNELILAQLHANEEKQKTLQKDIEQAQAEIDSSQELKERASADFQNVKKDAEKASQELSDAEKIVKATELRLHAIREAIKSFDYKKDYKVLELPSERHSGEINTDAVLVDHKLTQEELNLVKLLRRLRREEAELRKSRGEKIKKPKGEDSDEYSLNVVNMQSLELEKIKLERSIARLKKKEVKADQLELKQSGSEIPKPQITILTNSDLESGDPDPEPELDLDSDLDPDLEPEPEPEPDLDLDSDLDPDPDEESKSQLADYKDDLNLTINDEVTSQLDVLDEYMENIRKNKNLEDRKVDIEILENQIDSLLDGTFSNVNGVKYDSIFSLIDGDVSLGTTKKQSLKIKVESKIREVDTFLLPYEIAVEFPRAFNKYKTALSLFDSGKLNKKQYEAAVSSLDSKQLDQARSNFEYFLRGVVAIAEKRGYLNSFILKMPEFAQAYKLMKIISKADIQREKKELNYKASIQNAQAIMYRSSKDSEVYKKFLNYLKVLWKKKYILDISEKMIEGNGLIFTSKEARNEILAAIRMCRLEIDAERNGEIVNDVVYRRISFRPSTYYIARFTNRPVAFQWYMSNSQERFGGRRYDVWDILIGSKGRSVQMGWGSR